MTIALSELPNISEVGKVEEEGSELAGVPLANTLALSLLRTLGLPWVKEDTNMGSILLLRTPITFNSLYNSWNFRGIRKLGGQQW